MSKILQRATEAYGRLMLARARQEHAKVIDRAHEHKLLSFTALPGEFESPRSIPLYQSPDYEGRKGSTYRLMYVDGDLAWARESDHWGKLGGIDGTEPFEWTIDGAEHYGSRVAGYVLLADLATADLTATVLDAVTGMTRLKLAGELADKTRAMQTPGIKPLERMRLANELLRLLDALGVKAPDHPAVDALRAIATGEHDDDSLPEIYGRLQEAINTLIEVKALEGKAEALAHEAITHWAELESKHA